MERVVVMKIERVLYNSRQPLNRGLSYKQFRFLRSLFLGTLLAGSLSPAALAQNRSSGLKAKDPGPRPNPTSAIPKPVDNLNENEAALFN